METLADWAVAFLVAFLVAFRVHRDPLRVKASRTEPLPPDAIVRHVELATARRARWDREREEWEAALYQHLRRCELRWTAEGWYPPPEDRRRMYLVRPGGMVG